MAYYHQGAAFSYHSALLAFPKPAHWTTLPTRSPRPYISALFGFSKDAEYVTLATKRVRDAKLAKVMSMMAGFDNINEEKPNSNNLQEAYTSRFYIDVRNFLIDVNKYPSNSAWLQFIFQREALLSLRTSPSSNHKLEWGLCYDEPA